MKTLLLTTLLTATSLSTFAAPVATLIPTDSFVELNDETLDLLLSRARVSAGMDRGRVIEQLGQPAARIGTAVWVFTNFRAGNVTYAERYDTLLVIFKGDKVERVTLTNAQDIRMAARRSNAAGTATKVAAGQ